MKKIIILILITLAITSCGTNTEETKVKKYFKTINIQTGSIEEEANYV
jgi:hypothetical protein